MSSYLFVFGNAGTGIASVFLQETTLHGTHDDYQYGKQQKISFKHKVWLQI